MRMSKVQRILLLRQLEKEWSVGENWAVRYNRKFGEGALSFIDGLRRLIGLDTIMGRTKARPGENNGQRVSVHRVQQVQPSASDIS